MLVGEYVVVIEDERGSKLAQVIRTGSTGHPCVGEEIALAGRTYAVARVKHIDDPEEHSTRESTIAHVFVRLRPGAGPRPLSTGGSDATPVLPFTPPAAGATVGSAILPPSLVAVLVACGYRAQATYFKACSRATARLERDGNGGWFVESHAPEQAYRWSRRAKRHCLEVQAVMRDCALEATFDEPSVVLSPSLANSLQARSPSRPSGRPELRLV